MSLKDLLEMAGVLLNFVYFLLAFDMWAIWSFATAIAWSNLFFSLLEKNEKYVHKEYNKLDWQCFSLQNVSYDNTISESENLSFNWAKIFCKYYATIWKRKNHGHNPHSHFMHVFDIDLTFF